MDAPTLLLLFLFTCFCIHVFRSTSGRRRKLPPGPYPLPIIGNIFHLLFQGLLHSSLAKLSDKYGPLMSLRLGYRTAIVISSPEMAKELLQKNGTKCSNRSFPDAVRALDHHMSSIVWLPVTSSRWRSLRKLCRENLFSTERLNASQGLRQEIVQQLCDYVHECCMSGSGQAVDIGEAAFTTALNLISNTLFSVDFGRYDSKSSKEFKENEWNLMKNIVSPNLADFFPVLRVIDPQGLRRKTEFYLKKLFPFIDNMMRQRLEERATSIQYLRKDDLLETLLDLLEGGETELNLEDMRVLLLNLFSGGTETASATVEWAMAELIRKPETMSKAKSEIMEIIGQTELVLEESYISRLPYLQAVIKEIFRLHPPGPFLLRKADADMEINQYLIPKDAQLMVNLWAIGRDQSVWANPDSFIPERFLNCEINAKGQCFELLTFGTGRRLCVGLPLGHRMVHLMVVSLIHKFDWKLEDGLSPEDIDMSEKIGLTMHKALPLKAIPVLTTI